MDLDKLEKRIKMVSHRVRNINHGGCGVFALELYRIMKGEFGMESQIVFTGWRSSKSIDFDHIMLYCQGSWIDSKGLHATGPTNTMTEEELEELVADKRRWNPAFHYWFTDQYFKPISNENFLKRQMYNYISDKIS